MKKNINRKLILSILTILIVVLYIQADSSLARKTTKNAIITTDQDINFTLSQTFTKEFVEETTGRITNQSVDTILDQIPTFSANETQPFANRTYGEYYLTVIIDNITVFDDKDSLDAGEIYLEVWSNSIYAKLDNGGSNYLLNDGESAIINTITFDDWANLTDIFISVKDEDTGLDDELGTITISDIYDFDWSQGFYTDTSDAYIHISAFISGHRNVTIDENAVAYYYQPWLMLDNGDAADAPTALLYRVYEGYDIELSIPAICIQYLYYWPYELDDFGNLLGHYYDFSPLYLYITDFGEAPYRIVYQENNPGVTALPAELTIHSAEYVSDFIGSGTFNVSESLHPLLGETCSFVYNLHPISDYYNNGYYMYPNSEFPLLSTPMILITDSYHNIQTSYIALDTTELGFYPSLTCFDDSLIYSMYWLLNESFNSPLHDYAWNNYEVPENLSLTIDMLYNPFKFPYIIDCFENVTHQNRYARQNEETDFDGKIELTTTLDIPATIYIEHPSHMDPGDSETVSIWIDMHGDEVNLTFDYLADLNASFNMWFISKNITFNYDGQIEIQFPLESISNFQRKTGLNEFSDVYDFGNFLSIDSIYFDTTLLGTIFEASLSLHLLDIVRDLVGTFYPAVKPLLTISEYFVDDIDIVLKPRLDGLVIGDITTNQPSYVTLEKTSFSFLQENTPQNFNIEISSDFSGDSIDISLINLNYALNFTNSWDLVFVPGLLLGLFNVEETTISLGIFPNLQWSVAQPTDSLEATQSLLSQIETISQTTTTTTSTTTTTTTTTSPSGDGTPWSIYITVFAILALSSIKFRRRR
ncbi:MAG: hypothetical protein ACXABI_12285 [Candidatus Hodarchaeales archaeon]